MSSSFAANWLGQVCINPSVAGTARRCLYCGDAGVAVLFGADRLVPQGGVLITKENAPLSGEITFGRGDRGAP